MSCVTVPVGVHASPIHISRLHSLPGCLYKSDPSPQRHIRVAHGRAGRVYRTDGTFVHTMREPRGSRLGPVQRPETQSNKKPVQSSSGTSITHIVRPCSLVLITLVITSNRSRLVPGSATYSAGTWASKPVLGTKDEAHDGGPQPSRYCRGRMFQFRRIYGI